MNSTFYPRASGTAVLISGRKDYNRDAAQKTAQTMGKNGHSCTPDLGSGPMDAEPFRIEPMSALGLVVRSPDRPFWGAKRTVSTTRKRKWVQGLSRCPPDARPLAPLQAKTLPQSASFPMHAAWTMLPPARRDEPWILGCRRRPGSCETVLVIPARAHCTDSTPRLPRVRTY